MTATSKAVMPIQNALASVAVRELQSTGPWYERLIGRPADSTTVPELAEWTFEGGGCLQVYQNPDRAGLGAVTLAVSDLDEQIVKLKQGGIEPGATMHSPTSQLVMIKDPDGNSIAFAQALA